MNPRWMQALNRHHTELSAAVSTNIVAFSGL